jgi:hypothetical protein
MCSSQNGTQPSRVSAKNTFNFGKRSKTPDSTSCAMPTDGGSPKLTSHSRNGRRKRAITTGSSFGYIIVGWVARAPVR